MLKTFTALAVAGFTLCGCFAAPKVDTPDSPMEMLKLVEAMEKTANPQGKTYRSLRSVHEAELPQNGITMKITSSTRFPDRQRTETDIPGLSNIVEVFDGVRGWQIAPQLGAKPKNAREVAFMRLQIAMADPAAKLTKTFPTVVLDQKPVTVNGVVCRRLVCTPAKEIGLPPLELLVDAKKYQIVRVVAAIPTAMGDVPGTTDFANYKEIHGLLVPTEQTTKSLGMEIKAKLTGFEIDPELPDALFTPGDLHAN